jgi:excisionase family DNA binding protein
LSALTPSGDPDVQLWDVAAAARATGLSPRTVRRIFSERRVPVVKIGQLVRVRPADLESYIAANTRPANDRQSGR